MGLVTTTDGKPVTIYRKDKTTSSGKTFATYSIAVSSKDKDGNWTNGYLDCAFKKDVELNNKAKINITNSFYTVNEHNGKKYLKLFIMAFDVVEQGEVPPQAPSNDDSFMNIPDGIDAELPFE